MLGIVMGMDKEDIKGKKRIKRLKDWRKLKRMSEEVGIEKKKKERKRRIGRIREGKRILRVRIV